jgi:quinol-cytochrome oxidoreductase complex cytochrome b subunit
MAKFQRTPLPKQEKPQIDWTAIKAKWGKSTLVGIACGLVFMILIFLVYYIRYGQMAEWAFFQGYGLFMMIVGIIAIALKQYIFGGIFLGAAVLGFIANCIITYQQALLGEPNMTGGFVNLAVLFVGFLLAVILQVLARRKNVKKAQELKITAKTK